MPVLKSATSEPVDGPEGFPVGVRVYQCARAWEDLAVTQLDSVRHCDSCNQMVHHIEDADGCLLAIAERKCVRIMRRDGGYYIGEVSADYPAAPTKLRLDE